MKAYFHASIDGRQSRLLAGEHSGLEEWLASHRLLKEALPWLLLASTLAWAWHRIDLFHAVPTYGDTLEGIWFTWWSDNALRLGHGSGIYQLAFHPAGWRVATYAWGPVTLLFMLPLYRLGGGAFAYNVATLISFVIAFGGAYALGRWLMPHLGAAVAAFLYTFWGFRWYSVSGQLNISLGSALFPWFIFCLERAYHAAHRRLAWYAAAGCVWALSICSSFYFIWISGVAFCAWIVGHLCARNADRRQLLWRCLPVPLAAGLLSLPAVLAFWRASSAEGARSFSVYEVHALATSLNALPLPNLQHAWLSAVSLYLYHGAADAEVASTGLGLLTCLMAIVGFISVRRRVNWRPVFALAAAGLVFSLGLTLRWNDQTVQWPAARQVTRLLWAGAHFLRPAFFVGTQPPDPLKDAVLMPGVIVTALLPGFEQARVFARYAFLLGLAAFLLAGVGLSRVRLRPLRLALAVFLLFEAAPSANLSLPFPPVPHTAFEWLRQQDPQPQGLMELRPTTGDRLELPIGGPTIYATIYHQQATTGGAGSFIPGYTEELKNWLNSHAHPFQDPEFPVVMSAFKVKYLALHMSGGWQDEALQEAKHNPDLQFVQCFPTGGGLVWVNPICIFEYRPTSQAKFNFLLRDGWSGAEDWGRWIDGTTARSVWIGLAGAGQQIAIQAFPQCVEGRQQHVWLEVNGTPVGEHEWQGCEPWTGQIAVPSRLVRSGANELLIRAAYAAQPANGSEPRSLSLGVTRLRVEDAR